MPRPDTSSLVVELPSIDTPMADFVGQACGQTFPNVVIIRQPYKGVTANEAILQPIVSAPYSYRALETYEATLDAIRDVYATMSGNNPAIKFKFETYSPPPEAGIIDPSGPQIGSPVPSEVLVVNDAANLNAINALVQSASYYLKIARRIREYWANEYASDTQHGGQEDRHWALYQPLFDAYPECEGAEPGETVHLPPFGYFNCPTAEALLQHQEDEELYGDLIRAALYWSRCAQEAVRVVAMHYLNKAQYDLAHPSGGMQIGLPPEPPPDIGNVAPPPPPPPDGGDPPGPELPGPGDTGEPGPGEEPDPVPAPAAAPKRGFAGLSTPAKLAVVGGGGFVLYQLLARR